MRRTSLPVAIALAAGALAAAGFAGEPKLPFHVQRLSDRVVVFTEVSPWESNHVVVVTAKGLVLVDPGHTPLMGRLIRQAVGRELGRDRFAYVIDTHEHWGHTWGNAAFPEAVVIGHERAATAMQADAALLGPRLQLARGRVDDLEASLAKLDPASEEAQGLLIQRDHFDRIARGLGEPGIEVRPPDLTFSDRLRLDLGDVTLEMYYLGRGHSDSDIVTFIPQERVLLMGCFFLEQGPLPAFGTQAALDPDRWLEVFHAILDRDAPVQQVVLGQHSIWPRARLAALRDYVAEEWPKLKRLDADGVRTEEAMERMPVPEQLSFLRAPGVSDEDLQRFHRTEIMALWRQLKSSAAAQVEHAIASGGGEAGVARYRELAARTDDEYFFDENEFNVLGYRLLGQGKIDDAIAVLQLNVERFPDSWNVYDSLGEAFAAKGDRARAIELYRKSVALNPANTNGTQALQRLQGAAEKAPPTS